MRILVATHKLQGQRENDFYFCVEGELVKLPFDCDKDGDNPDGPCGCRRSFSGLESSKGTTTARVEERAMSLDEYRERMWRSHVNEGWAVADYGMTRGESDLIADAMMALAKPWVVGTILERRERVQERTEVRDAKEAQA